MHAAAGAGGAKQTVKDANGVDVDIKTVLQENVNMKREFQDKEVQVPLATCHLSFLPGMFFAV